MTGTGGYLKAKGGLSFGRNDLTSGLARLPDLSYLRTVAREVRRLGKLNRHPLTRATMMTAYERAIDTLNPEND